MIQTHVCTCSYMLFYQRCSNITNNCICKDIKVIIKNRNWESIHGPQI